MNANRSFWQGLRASVCVAVVICSTHALSADDSLREGSSLRLAPADASFYFASMNNRAKLEAFTQSRAMEQLLEEIPELAAMIAMIEQRWPFPAANEPLPDALLEQLPPGLSEEDARILLTAPADMLSNDLFVYADGSLAELMELAELTNDAQAEMSNWEALFNETIELFFGSTAADALEGEGELPDDDAAGGFGSGGAANEAAMIAALEIASEHLDLIRAPTIVVGCRFSDGEMANGVFDLWERFSGEIPLDDGDPTDQAILAFIERFEPFDTAKGRFYTTTFRLSELAEEELPDGGIERVPEEYRHVAEHLLDMPVVVSFGAWRDYGLIVVSDSTERLEELGQGDVLIDAAQLSPLREIGDAPLSSVRYVSEEMARAWQELNDTPETLSQVARTLADGSDLQIDPQLREEIAADLEEFAGDLASFVPEAGASLTFSYLTDRGIEGYAYDWSENLELDGSERLTILDHVGGDPIFLSARRRQYSLDGYDFLVKWSTRGLEYADAYLPTSLSEENLEDYERWRDLLVPMLKRANIITREQFLPAFEDGQSAFVIDADLESTSWFAGMPEAEEPLPLPEVAVVYGISDAEGLKQAGDAYRQLTEELVRRLAELERESGSESPILSTDFVFPRPLRRENDAGTFYFYTSEEWGFDSQFLPNVVVTENYALASLSAHHSRRLLERHPLAAVTIVNFAGTVEAIEPWLRYAISHGDEIQGAVDAFNPLGIDDFEAEALDGDAGGVDPFDEEPFDEPGGDFDAEEFFPEEGEFFPEEPFAPAPAFDPERALQQSEVVTTFLKCFRGYSSATYIEDGATVTHYEYHFEDLPE